MLPFSLALKSKDLYGVKLSRPIRGKKRNGFVIVEASKNSAAILMVPPDGHGCGSTLDLVMLCP